MEGIYTCCCGNVTMCLSNVWDSEDKFARSNSCVIFDNKEAQALKEKLVKDQRDAQDNFKTSLIRRIGKSPNNSAKIDFYCGKSNNQNIAANAQLSLLTKKLQQETTFSFFHFQTPEQTTFCSGTSENPPMCKISPLLKKRKVFTLVSRDNDRRRRFKSLTCLNCHTCCGFQSKDDPNIFIVNTTKMDKKDTFSPEASSSNPQERSEFLFSNYFSQLTQVPFPEPSSIQKKPSDFAEEGTNDKNSGQEIMKIDVSYSETLGILCFEPVNAPLSPPAELDEESFMSDLEKKDPKKAAQLKVEIEDVRKTLQRELLQLKIDTENRINLYTQEQRTKYSNLFKNAQKEKKMVINELLSDLLQREEKVSTHISEIPHNKEKLSKSKKLEDSSEDEEQDLCESVEKHTEKFVIMNHPELENAYVQPAVQKKPTEEEINKENQEKEIIQPQTQEITQKQEVSSEQKPVIQISQADDHNTTELDQKNQILNGSSDSTNPDQINAEKSEKIETLKKKKLKKENPEKNSKSKKNSDAFVSQSLRPSESHKKSSKKPSFEGDFAFEEVGFDESKDVDDADFDDDFNDVNDEIAPVVQHTETTALHQASQKIQLKSNYFKNSEQDLSRSLPMSIMGPPIILKKQPDYSSRYIFEGESTSYVEKYLGNKNDEEMGLEDEDEIENVNKTEKKKSKSSKKANGSKKGKKTKSKSSKKSASSKLDEETTKIEPAPVVEPAKFEIVVVKEEDPFENEEDSEIPIDLEEQIANEDTFDVDQEFSIDRPVTNEEYEDDEDRVC